MATILSVFSLELSLGDGSEVNVVVMKIYSQLFDGVRFGECFSVNDIN